MGIAFARDGWEAGNVGFMLKCGPYGGFMLNEYRNRQDHHPINVAHDDPDANTFCLYAAGAMLVQDGGYAGKKRSSSQNTILVNGKGQKGEGGQWTQPLKGEDADMTKLARVVTLHRDGERMVVEGEAGGAYADLSRYRRCAAWMPGQYILLLDDIRAPREAEITWLVQSPSVEIVDEARRRYRIASGSAACELVMASASPTTAAVAASTAESKGKSRGWRQLQVKDRGTVWRLATAFDAWNRRNLQVEMKADGPAAATVTVTGPGFADTWTWKCAPDEATPASLVCQRGGKPILEVGPKDKVPVPTKTIASP